MFKRQIFHNIFITTLKDVLHPLPGYNSDLQISIKNIGIFNTSNGIKKNYNIVTEYIYINLIFSQSLNSNANSHNAANVIRLKK